MKKRDNENHTMNTAGAARGNRIGMEANGLPSLRSNLASFFTHYRPFRSQISFCTSPHSPKLLRAGSSNSNSEEDEGSLPAIPPPVTPPDTVEIRFRRGSRRRSRQLQQQEGLQGGPTKKPSTPKDWESMTLAEKAIELYVGEKGLLFWLNKFAYASIFIIIGGWILFRFVGPSLGLYQLDSPPLSPSSLLKG